MEVDVLIVGAGPAGLSAACRLAQIAQEEQREIRICVLEKGAEVGAHILSGAVFEPTALNELFADWKERGAPLNTPVERDHLYYLSSAQRALPVPGLLAPRQMHNQGNYIISLGVLCRWLAEQAEALGVDIFPGFAAAELLFDDDDGRVVGVLTGDMGRSADGSKGDGFAPGMELRATYTLFAEGCRGHLGMELMQRFALNKNRDPQHYALGIKELWQVSPEQHHPGTVMHFTGWPLSENNALGGGFLYHLEDRQISLGLVTDLNYDNPYLNPFEEFQRMKQHPLLRDVLVDGQRIAYGARAITKGGPQSLPRMHFPGGLLIGCDAGTLNYAKIKGSHTAMKSGMLAAESVAQALAEQRLGEDLNDFAQRLRDSWLWSELHVQRNFGPAQHRFGNLWGSAYAWLDLNLARGLLPWTWHDRQADHEGMRCARPALVINYPKPDGKISFDRLSSVYLSNTNHREGQACHLLLADPELPIRDNLPQYAEPAQRYCPAAVYEVIDGKEGGAARFQINAQNCVHCKTCDIKDPAANIRWVPPEGGGGPSYPNM